MASTSSLSRPGKTSPCLIDDLVCYDPGRLGPRSHNVLTDPPIEFREDLEYPSRCPPGNCKHNLLLKDRQSTFTESSDWRVSIEQLVAAYCSTCRCHFEILVRTPATFASPQSCPNETHLLHHWIFSPQLSSSRFDETNDNVTWVDRQVFECSNLGCCAAVTIEIKPPRLGTDDIFILTDRPTIKARAASHIAQERDIAIPEPAKVLDTLRLYLLNALQDQSPRKIPALNRRFLPAFGDAACAKLLQRLGFTFESLEEDFWNPPKVPPPSKGPWLDPQRKFLDDVIVELQQLICQRQWTEVTKAGATQVRAFPAMKHIEIILGCSDYQKRLSARRNSDLREPHPYYAVLGARDDFADQLLEFAHERQRACDPDKAAYYFDCFLNLASGRKSTELNTRIAMLRSEGAYTTTDVDEAYRFFGLSAGVPDNVLIGTFNARIEDSPRQEADAREKLGIIGQARNSETIMHTVSGTVATYNQALNWLGAQSDTPDEFIVTLLSIKVSDGKVDESKARDAIRIIAEERNSELLKNFLATGDIGNVEMDIGEAYNRLGISDRTVDDDLIITTFDIRTQESPADAHNLRAALAAIGKEKKSQTIENFLTTGKTTSDYNPIWPVGLENIGNTCYLNSLLQFYYTVRPLRDLVYEIDKYLERGGASRKQVGGRKVSRGEVERAQRFVHELQKLFVSLRSEQKSSITPETELARLTLLSSTNEEHFRRMSMASVSKPPELEVKSGAVFGPHLPNGALENPSVLVNSPDMEIDLPEKIRESMDDDTASDDTLIGDSITKPEPAASDRDYILVDKPMVDKAAVEDKENDVPKPDGSAIDHHRPLGEVPATELNKLPETESEHDDLKASPISTTNILTPPESPVQAPQPPVVPPRPTDAKAKDELELGAQQDVTEVISNVLFQLECAIRPLGMDSNGEQQDEIKDLFYGKSKIFVRMPKETKVMEELFSDIKIDVASGSRDVYAALDAAFDEQTIEIEGTTAPMSSAISRLPPILQIQVQRVQFDPLKKTSFKSESHLELKEQIFMDRYLDRKDLYPVRERAWKLKAEIAALETRKANINQNELELSKSELLELTDDFLKQSDEIMPSSAEGVVPFSNEELSTALKSEAAAASTELSTIDEQILAKQQECAGLFSEYKDSPYRLHSVFIHRGSVSFGHYWIYIYDFDQKIWRKYNDSYVTEVRDINEIFAIDESRGSKATSYFLVYVQEGKEDELVGSVWRDALLNQAANKDEDEDVLMDLGGETALKEEEGEEQDLVPSKPIDIPVPSKGPGRAATLDSYGQQPHASYVGMSEKRTRSDGDSSTGLSQLAVAAAAVAMKKNSALPKKTSPPPPPPPPRRASQQSRSYSPDNGGAEDHIGVI